MARLRYVVAGAGGDKENKRLLHADISKSLKNNYICKFGSQT